MVFCDGFLQMTWLIPDTQHELLWDHGMCADTSRGAAIRELISRACKGALAPAQQKVPSFLCLCLSSLFSSHNLLVLSIVTYRLFVIMGNGCPKKYVAFVNDLACTSRFLKSMS